MTVDPLTDKFAWVSPFNYAENEPIEHIDLWGLQKWDIQYRYRDLKLLKGEWTAKQYSEDVHATDLLGPVAAIPLLVTGGSALLSMGEAGYLYTLTNPETVPTVMGVIWGLGTDEDLPGGADDFSRMTKKSIEKSVEKWVSNNSKRLNKKLGEKIGKSKDLPFEASFNGFKQAIKTVKETLINPSKISNEFKDRGGNRVIDIYSKKSKMTVRVKTEDASFHTLISGKTKIIKETK